MSEHQEFLPPPPAEEEMEQVIQDEKKEEQEIKEVWDEDMQADAREHVAQVREEREELTEGIF